MSTPSVTAPSPFIVLASVAQSQTALAQQTQIAEISQDLQNQLNTRLAALQTPTDQVSVDLSQQRISALETQLTAVSASEKQFGNNSSLLSDMTSQLSLMAQAVTNSDGTGFDAALSALNTDLTDLTPPGFNPLFQNDGTTAFKNNGFTIQSSASYNLSTTSGQAAATTDVTNAQNLVEAILNINGNNQTIAASQTTALDGQINALQTLQSQQQDSQSQQVAQETAQLQQNMQNQLHLIELNLGTTTQTANMLSLFSNPPAQVTSVFGALINAVGETGTTAENQLGQTPAVLSLFA
jgi:hypothetical protein